MARPKYPKIIILNIGGGHGHFLHYSLDKFCIDTPKIDTLPFNDLGNSHNNIKYSDQFVFDDGIHDAELNFKKQNIIFIDIEGEPLYFERANIHRAGDAATDLFSETAIAKFLRANGSTFPDYCESKNISLREGYMHGFKNLEQQGSMVRNKKRLEKILSQDNNVFRYSIRNFFSLDKFKQGFGQISNHFAMPFNLDGIDELYNEFYKRNTILQSHSKVNEYINGNKDLQLDILQQAYVDALEN